MLDNLVRPTAHVNQTRDENRTDQLNTLPITLHGLPFDSKIAEGWHDPTCVTEDHKCNCKKSLLLNKKDFDTIFIKPLPAEEDAFTKFANTCTWGNKVLMNDCFMPEPYESQEFCDTLAIEESKYMGSKQ